MNNENSILIRNGYVKIPNITSSEPATKEDIATILMNLSYYGYALSQESYDVLMTMSYEGLSSWWKNIEPSFKDITGDNRNIDSFVVYKNFPAEVLNKTEAEYWLPQILMYWGFPNEYFTEEAKPRKKMMEKGKASVLRLSRENTLSEILNSYLRSPARWKEQELNDVLFLTKLIEADIAEISFKENLVKLISSYIAENRYVNVATATDVLRLAAGLSGGDVSLREKVKFASFKKPVRKYLLGMLEECSNLAEDIGRRPEIWKRLIHQLHPGDYAKACPNVCKVADSLYKGMLAKPNSHLEHDLLMKDPKVLKHLASRPGEFKRRLVHVLDALGEQVIDAFRSGKVIKKLTNAQLVSLKSLFNSNGSKKQRVFPPKGNWNKLKLGQARHINADHVKKVVSIIDNELKTRLPKVKVLDPLTKMVKLPNDGEVSPYARGTVFPIPEDVEFIRTASYWATKRTGNVWFDNGWNFFDKDWKSLGACCWLAQAFPNSDKNKGAIFSGDPTNSKEMKGRAAQLIDLYPAKLIQQGVRYAVWNILCYSKIPFSDAEDVFAALQWGKEPQKGKLFEPSRCQLSFPLKSKHYTKYVCVIDLEKREMIYIDANLKSQVYSATYNTKVLEEQMPAFMQYLDSLPSVYDLFESSVDENGEANILYSDKETSLKDVPAYVFKMENKDNAFKQIDLNQLLK